MIFITNTSVVGQGMFKLECWLAFTFPILFAMALASANGRMVIKFGQAHFNWLPFIILMHKQSKLVNWQSKTIWLVQKGKTKNWFANWFCVSFRGSGLIEREYATGMVSIHWLFCLFIDSFQPGLFSQANHWRYSLLANENCPFVPWLPQGCIPIGVSVARVVLPWLSHLISIRIHQHGNLLIQIANLT